jgi:hypothetical protein
MYLVDMDKSHALTTYKRRNTQKPKKRPKKGSKPPRTRTPLTPYEFTFCEWLATQSVPPKSKEQLAKLNEIYNPPDKDGNPPSSPIPVNRQRLDNLKRRQDFKEYYNKMLGEELQRSREMFIKRMPNAVAAHFDAMNLAMIHSDYRAVPSFTNPVLDRVMPRKQEAAPIAAVKIELTPAQQQFMDIGETVVEVEEIVNSGDSDPT